MQEKKFEEKVSEMFEDKLGYEEYPVIRIKDVKNNKIMDDLNYEKLIRFGHDLKIYKLGEGGRWVDVNNSDFVAVIVAKEKYKTKPLI